ALAKDKDAPDVQAVVPQDLLDDAQANPKSRLDVIVQGDGSEKSDKLADRLAKSMAKDQGLKGDAAKSFLDSVESQFSSINGFAITLSGKDVLKVAKSDNVVPITRDTALTA